VLARSNLTAAVYGMGTGTDNHAADADTALDEVVARLVRDGDLTLDVASVDESRNLQYPAMPGLQQIDVIVYTPQIVVGRSSAPRMPTQHTLDPRFLRTTEVGGHLRSIGHLGWKPSAVARAAYRDDKRRFGLAGPPELPSGYTYVSPFTRGA
jgi:hypothetical protein